jgi:hypothetical protein
VPRTEDTEDLSAEQVPKVEGKQPFDSAVESGTKLMNEVGPRGSFLDRGNDEHTDGIHIQEQGANGQEQIAKKLASQAGISRD